MVPFVLIAARMSNPRILGILASSSGRCGCSIAVLAAACGGNGAPTSSHLTADAGIADGQARDHAAAPLADAAGDVADSMGQPADGAAAAEAGSPGAPDGAAGSVQPGADGGPRGSVLRFADWAPDAASAGYDLCIAAPGDLSWMGPLLGTGVPFPRVSQYVQVPAGIYDVRVIAAGGSCMTPIASSVGLPMITSTTRMTFALVGAVTPRGDDSPAKIAAFADDFAAASSRAAVRFINASGAAAAVDFGTGSLAAGNFQPLATDVLFGEASSEAPDGGAPDTNGYLLIAPRSAVTVSARVIDGTMDLATGTNATWAAGSVDTIALVNGGSNDAMPQLVSCRDDAPAVEGFSVCALLGR